jgi:hypothetical protein
MFDEGFLVSKIEVYFFVPSSARINGAGVDAPDETGGFRLPDYST